MADYGPRQRDMPNQTTYKGMGIEGPMYGVHCPVCNEDITDGEFEGTRESAKALAVSHRTLHEQSGTWPTNAELRRMR
jgi:hypothetical protein